MTTVVSHADAMSDEVPDLRFPTRSSGPRATRPGTRPRSWPSTSGWTATARGRCCAARACTPRCCRSGASGATGARCRR